MFQPCKQVYINKYQGPQYLSTFMFQYVSMYMKMRIYAFIFVSMFPCIFYVMVQCSSKSRFLAMICFIKFMFQVLKRSYPMDLKSSNNLKKHKIVIRTCIRKGKNKWKNTLLNQELPIQLSQNGQVVGHFQMQPPTQYKVLLLKVAMELHCQNLKNSLQLQSFSSRLLSLQLQHQPLFSRVLPQVFSAFGFKIFLLWHLYHLKCFLQLDQVFQN